MKGAPSDQKGAPEATGNTGWGWSVGEISARAGNSGRLPYFLKTEAGTQAQGDKCLILGNLKESKCDSFSVETSRERAGRKDRPECPSPS